MSACLQGRGSLSPSDSGRGAIRWYEKIMNKWTISKSFDGKINIFVHCPHPRSLSAFVFNLKEMIISRLAIGEH